MEKMEFFNPSIEQLVTEIVAVNQGWKLAREMFGKTAPVTISLRNMKNRLQVRLLRSYPAWVYLKLDEETEQCKLELDTDAEQGEPLYGLRLREPIGERWNAEHLPVRVAKKVLMEEELQQLIRSSQQ